MAINREELKKLGLEEDAISKVLDMHHAELKPYKEKAEQYEAEKTRADKLKADFDEQSKKIAGLEKLTGNEDGLKAEIERLKTEAKDKEVQYLKDIEDAKKQADDIAFNSILDGVLSGAKAKSLKAVKAELDIENLKASKNREADIKKAVDALVEGEDTAFLFGEKESKPTGNKVNFPGGTAGGSSEDLAVQKARAVMGLPTEKK